MPLRPTDEEVIPLGVQFTDEVVIVSYLEPREVSEAAMIQRSMTIDPDQVEEELEDLRIAVRNIIDAGALLIRKPPSKLSRTAAMVRAETGEDPEVD